MENLVLIFVVEQGGSLTPGGAFRVVLKHEQKQKNTAGARVGARNVRLRGGGSPPGRPRGELARTLPRAACAPRARGRA